MNLLAYPKSLQVQNEAFLYVSLLFYKKLSVSRKKSYHLFFNQKSVDFLRLIQNCWFKDQMCYKWNELNQTKPNHSKHDFSLPSAIKCISLAHAWNLFENLNWPDVSFIQGWLLPPSTKWQWLLTACQTTDRRNCQHLSSSRHHQEVSANNFKFF